MTWLLPEGHEDAVDRDERAGFYGDVYGRMPGEGSTGAKSEATTQRGTAMAEPPYSRAAFACHIDESGGVASAVIGGKLVPLDDAAAGALARNAMNLSREAQGGVEGKAHSQGEPFSPPFRGAVRLESNAAYRAAIQHKHNIANVMRYGVREPRAPRFRAVRRALSRLFSFLGFVFALWLVFCWAIWVLGVSL